MSDALHRYVIYAVTGNINHVQAARSQEGAPVACQRSENAIMAIQRCYIHSRELFFSGPTDGGVVRQESAIAAPRHRPHREIRLRDGSYNRHGVQVPNGHRGIIAPHRQQRPALVRGAGDADAGRAVGSELCNLL